MNENVVLRHIFLVTTRLKFLRFGSLQLVLQRKLKVLGARTSNVAKIFIPPHLEDRHNTPFLSETIELAFVPHEKGLSAQKAVVQLI